MKLKREYCQQIHSEYIKDDLSDIKARIGQDNIKYCESPKINTNKRKILTFKKKEENTK